MQCIRVFRFLFPYELEQRPLVSLFTNVYCVCLRSYSLMSRSYLAAKLVRTALRNKRVYLFHQLFDAKLSGSLFNSLSTALHIPVADFVFDPLIWMPTTKLVLRLTWVRKWMAMRKWTANSDLVNVRVSPRVCHRQSRNRDVQRVTHRIATATCYPTLLSRTRSRCAVKTQRNPTTIRVSMEWMTRQNRHLVLSRAHGISRKMDYIMRKPIRTNLRVRN